MNLFFAFIYLIYQKSHGQNQSKVNANFYEAPYLHILIVLILLHAACYCCWRHYIVKDMHSIPKKKDYLSEALNEIKKSFTSFRLTRSKFSSSGSHVIIYIYIFYYLLALRPFIQMHASNEGNSLISFFSIILFCFLG